MTDFFSQVDAILISSASQIAFLTGYSNFSPIEREAYLLITPTQKYILTDARYTEAVMNLEGFILKEISGEVGMNQHLNSLAQKHRIQKLGVEGDNLTVAEFKRFEKIIPQLQEIKLDHLRSVKTTEEISKIETACQIGDQAFEYLLKKIKPEITEKELALEYELYVRKKGANISFDTIIAFGPRSSIPHHHTGNQVLFESRKRKADGIFIKMDFGVRNRNYCSDMTRTVIWGKASVKQKKIYRTVLNAQKKAAEFLQQRIKESKEVIGREVDRVAREYIVSQGFPSIPHGLGHGIGIEVHEAPRLSPRSDDKLVEGMVFSIEPGIYIPGFGGVRIEDLYVIEKNGLRRLTKASQELIEL